MCLSAEVPIRYFQNFQKGGESQHDFNFWPHPLHVEVHKTSTHCCGLLQNYKITRHYPSISIYIHLYPSIPNISKDPPKKIHIPTICLGTSKGINIHHPYPGYQGRLTHKPNHRHHSRSQGSLFVTARGSKQLRRKVGERAESQAGGPSKSVLNRDFSMLSSSHNVTDQEFLDPMS